MSVTTIDAAALSRMFLAGVKQLESRKEYINELNVFPVPDGDTGTNMTLTILSAAKEVQGIGRLNMENLAKAISSGSLRGARGNSGVILSQLLRGFTKEISDKSVLDTKIIADAFVRGQNTAYKAVMKPKEGTILTVAREMASAAQEIAETETDFEKFGEIVLARGYAALESTPDLLPVLKEAGVVDSGGQGLMEILQGIFDCLMGKEVDYTLEEVPARPSAARPSVKPRLKEEELTYGYCTEFIIMTKRTFTEYDENEMKEFLTSIGDSLVCVVDDGLVKIHVHTDHPGKAFEKGLAYGELTSMKVDNLREEHREVLFQNAQKQEEESKEEAPVPNKAMGFIVVSIGEGINNIFRDLGADYIIEGGQTMNPSTDDMLNAIENVHADNIFILPNNKNIILAANQAKDLVEGKNIFVIPTKTIPQGIASMINYMPENDAQSNFEAMSEAIGEIRTGQVTYAVRDTHIDNKEIHQGDIMGIGDDGLLAVGSDINETAVETISGMTDEDSEIISVYYGNDVTKKQVESLTETIEEKFPDLEVEVYSGGQPIYYYVMSVE